jgi:CheY-like chemotaxis protein
MDLNMPVMDGATATNYIVKMQEDNLVSKELRVIALTAYDSPEHKAL